MSIDLIRYTGVTMRSSLQCTVVHTIGGLVELYDYPMCPLKEGETALGRGFVPQGKYIRTKSNSFSKLEKRSLGEDDGKISYWLLRAIKDNQIKAFTSEFGFLSNGHHQYEGWIVYPLREFETLREFIKQLKKAADTGNLNSIKALFNQENIQFPNGVPSLRHELDMEDETLISRLHASSLFSYCAYEILNSYREGRSFRSCLFCGEFLDEKKRVDAKYCNRKCRIAEFRKKRIVTTV